MQGPIHSKGVGRSGPKRKTGCLTCRRRKVRCDETRPVCANCVRLRLECEYASTKEGASAASHRPTTPLASTSRHASLTASQGSYISSEQAPLLDPSGAYMLPSGSTTPYPEEQGIWTVPSQPVASFDVAIPNQTFPSFDNFDLNTAFSDSPDAYFQSASFSASVNETPLTMPIANATFGVVKTEMSMQADDRRQKLMQHLVDSVNPTSLIEPTPTRWLTSRQTILQQSQECACLSSAILATASLNLHETTGEDCVNEAIEYYKSASREATAILDESAVDDRRLKQAFATLFWLVYIEVLSHAITRPKHTVFPLRQLRTFQHRMHQHRIHIESWTGISKLLLTWTSLLIIKAEWNSADVTLQHSSSSLRLSAASTTGLPLFSPKDADSNSTSGSQSMDNEGPRDFSGSEEVSSTFTLTYDTLNNPGYEFHLSAQGLISRILNLHRDVHDSIPTYMDLDTVTAGQKLSTDLQSLWSGRPSTMNLLLNAEALENVLQPELAQTIVLNLRVYAANFFALMVDLHRSAFTTYPASRDAQTAVRRIFALGREILQDANRRRNLQKTSPSSSSTHSGTSGAEQAQMEPLGESASTGSTKSGTIDMPAMMLWPLFLAALEGSATERAWILHVFQRMDKRTHPTAARIVPLLQETLRRQDEGGVRVDHRTVMKELFGDELAVLF